MQARERFTIAAIIRVLPAKQSPQLSFLYSRSMPQRKSAKRLQLLDRNSGKRLGILAILLSLVFVVLWFLMVWMPGRSYGNALEPLTAVEVSLSQTLNADIATLAAGPRSNPESLEEAAQYIEQRFAQAGLTSQRQTYEVSGNQYSNIIAEIRGSDRPDQIVLIGAHYDTAYTTPGANDNASGVAATLALAERFGPNQGKVKPARTLRFVAFVNEEPPYFHTKNMGSLVYAQQAKRDGDDIIAMLSLETLGYYSDEPGSQKYPSPLNWLYPDTGNFIAFIGDVSSRKLVRTSIHDWRDKVQFPSEGAALPRGIPGIGWSDHWSFWQLGYPAVMVTDTATYRDPHYHTDDDRQENIDGDRLTRVVNGLGQLIGDFVGQSAA